MLSALFQLIRTGKATESKLFPDLPEYSRGLPRVTGAECEVQAGCNACVATCPTNAIDVMATGKGGPVSLDLGKCIAWGECTFACPTGTIVNDRRTRVAVRTREELELSNNPVQPKPIH